MYPVFPFIAAMKTRILPTTRLSTGLFSIALALLASASLASAQTTVALDFESETAGITTVPSGWSYSTVGAGKSYTTSAVNGGTNDSGAGTGLGGVLVSDNATHGTVLPNAFLLNSGTPAGFDTSKAITGTYDFKHAHASAYDSSAFLFGDIKAASFPKTDPGQFLLAYHSNGGYGNAPNRIVSGTEGDLTSGIVAGHADDVWYRVTFSWTPTAGTKGNFTWSSKRLSNNTALASLTANGVTLTPAGAYLGFADLYAPNTTFDNISVTGTTFAGAYWDTNGTDPGAGNPADGTWDGTAKWNPSSDGTGTPAAWTAGDVAIFSAGNDATGPYTVTVSGTQDIGGLSFENGTPTLTDGTLRMVSDSYAYVKPGSTATIASAISDDAGSRVFSKTGTGTLILTGDNSGASGSMKLADGITEVEAVNSILGAGKNLTLDANATLLLRSGIGSGNIPTALNRIVGASAGTIAADNYDSTNFDFNTPALSTARLGAVGTVSHTGTLTPAGTTYRLGGGGGTLTMANTNAVTGAGNSLVVQGNVVLAGSNDYDSGTTLNSGTLTLGDAGSLGAGGLTITGGAIAASGTVAATNTIAANGNFGIGGTGALTLGGNMTLNANRIITNNNTTDTTTFGAISGATRTLTFSGNGNTTISGNITTTTGTLIKNGTGILILDGANTNSGTTTVNGGTLVLSGSNSSAGATTLEAATLQLDSDSNGGLASGQIQFNQNAGVLQAVTADRVISNNMLLNASPTISGSQSLTINGTVTINNNRTLTNNITGTGKSLTLSNITRDGSNNRNLVLSGNGDTTVNGTVVLGTGTFTKSGNGTVTLNNTNTYTGTTTVNNGGTLLVNGDSSASTNTVTVNNTATLGGSGTLGGSVTITASANLAPGNASVGTLSLAGALNVSAMAGGTGLIRMELGPIATSDKIVAGTLNIGTDVFNFSDFNFTALSGLQDGTYKLITSGATVIGTIDPTPENLTGPVGTGTGLLRISDGGTGNDIELVISGVTGGGNTFATWIATYPGVGAFTGVGDDPDADGIVNGVENFFGTNPSASSAGLVAGVVSGNTFTFTHPQNATPASDLTAAYQWSKDLATFNASGFTDGDGTTVTISPQLDTPAPGTTTVTATVTGTATGKLFVNIKVTQP
jgi:autotransporter-associated beta strand protein